MKKFILFLILLCAACSTEPAFDTKTAAKEQQQIYIVKNSLVTRDFGKTYTTESIHVLCQIGTIGIGNGGAVVSFGGMTYTIGWRQAKVFPNGNVAEIALAGEIYYEGAFYSLTPGGNC